MSSVLSWSWPPGVVHELEPDELRELLAVVVGVGVPTAVLPWAADDPV